MVANSPVPDRACHTRGLTGENPSSSLVFECSRQSCLNLHLKTVNGLVDVVIGRQCRACMHGRGAASHYCMHGGSLHICVRHYAMIE